MSEKIKKSFVFHAEWIEAIEDLPPEKAVRLIRILTDYSCSGGVEPTIDDPILRALFKAFKPRIKEDIEKYKDKCKKSTEAVNQRWEKEKEESKEEVQSDTNEYECIPTYTDVSKNTDTDTVSDSDSEYDSESVFLNGKNREPPPKPKTKTRKFVPPTAEEVRAYCLEKHFDNFDPDYFVAYYEASDWKKGNNVKVQNWKALAKQWNLKSWNNNKAPPPKKADRITFFDDLKDVVIDLPFVDKTEKKE